MFMDTDELARRRQILLESVRNDLRQLRFCIAEINQSVEGSRRIIAESRRFIAALSPAPPRRSRFR